MSEARECLDVAAVLFEVLERLGGVVESGFRKLRQRIAEVDGELSVDAVTDTWTADDVQ